MKICPGCGTTYNDKHIEFCGNCGMDLRGVPEQKKHSGLKIFGAIVVGLVLCATIVGALVGAWAVTHKKAAGGDRIVYYTEDGIYEYLKDSGKSDRIAKIDDNYYGEVLDYYYDYDYDGGYINLADYVQFTPNYRYAFFMNDFEDSYEYYKEASLYYTDLGVSENDRTAVKVADNLNADDLEIYKVTSLGNIVYLDSNNRLILATISEDGKSIETEKLARNVSSFYTSEDGTKIMYVDGLYNSYSIDLNKGTDRTELTKDIYDVVYTSDDMSLIYLQTNDSNLVCIKDMDKAEIVDTDVWDSLAMDKTGHVYYIKSKDKCKVKDFIIDKVDETVEETEAETEAETDTDVPSSDYEYVPDGTLSELPDYSEYDIDEETLKFIFVMYRAYGYTDAEIKDMLDSYLESYGAEGYDDLLEHSDYSDYVDYGDYGDYSDYGFYDDYTDYGDYNEYELTWAEMLDSDLYSSLDELWFYDGSQKTMIDDNVSYFNSWSETSVKNDVVSYSRYDSKKMKKIEVTEKPSSVEDLIDEVDIAISAASVTRMALGTEVVELDVFNNDPTIYPGYVYPAEDGSKVLYYIDYAYSDENAADYDYSAYNAATVYKINYESGKSSKSEKVAENIEAIEHGYKDFVLLSSYDDDYNLNLLRNDELVASKVYQFVWDDDEVNNDTVLYGMYDTINMDSYNSGTFGKYEHGELKDLLHDASSMAGYMDGHIEIMAGYDGVDGEGTLYYMDEDDNEPIKIAEKVTGYKDSDIE